MKVLDIKQSSEKNLIFYQDQIASVIKKIPAIHFDKMTRNIIIELEKQFINYRMTLYVYAYASFLEVMLLGNFQQEYLEQAANKTKEYNEQYRKNLLQCRNLIKNFSKNSVESKILSGLGTASKALGNLISSSDFLKQGPVDEWLKDGGEKILQENNKMIERTETLFASEEIKECEVFIESIKSVRMISLQATDILFDKDNLYIATS
ncbi:MAG: hypothetical protein IKH57_26360 [Clostridia bacterium]|nr:hypothetical protein [Clostridia bacterium]